MASELLRMLNTQYSLVVKFECYLITTLNIAHLLHRSVITFHRYPREDWSIFPCWHEVIFFAVEFGLVRSQPFPLPRYFVIDVPPSACRRLSKSVFLIMLGSYPLVCWTDRCRHHHHLHRRRRDGCPFNHFRTHCTIFWHTALSLIPWQCVCISWLWILQVEACFGHRNLLRLQISSRNMFSSATAFVPQIMPWRALNDWRLRHLLLCLTSYRCFLQPKDKMLGWK